MNMIITPRQDRLEALLLHEMGEKLHSFQQTIHGLTL